jgi:hypothetical protein
MFCAGLHKRSRVDAVLLSKASAHDAQSSAPLRSTRRAEDLYNTLTVALSPIKANACAHRGGFDDRVSFPLPLMNADRASTIPHVSDRGNSWVLGVSHQSWYGLTIMLKLCTVGSQAFTADMYLRVKDRERLGLMLDHFSNVGHIMLEVRCDTHIFNEARADSALRTLDRLRIRPSRMMLSSGRLLVT